MGGVSNQRRTRPANRAQRAGRRRRPGDPGSARAPQRVRRQSLIAELRTAFAGLAGEPPDRLRAVVLAGDGPSFCAGADVGWMRAALELDVEANEQDAMAMAEMFDAIDTCPVPVIARVHGAALGGGTGLCAVSDLVIAESGHPLRLHRDAPGDPAGGDLAVRHRQDRRDERPGALPRRPPLRCGPGPADRPRPRARRGRRRRWTRPSRRRLADVLAAGPTAARAAKSIVREVRGLPHGSSKWHTARVIARQRRSPEAQEGLRAFLEKRSAELDARGRLAEPRVARRPADATIASRCPTS